MQSVLSSARQTAAGIREQILSDGSLLEEIGYNLDQSVRAIEDGRKSLGKLEQLPDREQATTDLLRERLEGFGPVVEAAVGGIKDAERRLVAARRSAEELIDSSINADTGRQASAVIEKAGSEIKSHVEAARTRVAGLTESLDQAQSGAHEAAQRSVDLANARVAALQAPAKQSAELANAARAGMNPTPKWAQQISTGSGESDLRHRPGEGQTPTHER